LCLTRAPRWGAPAPDIPTVDEAGLRGFYASTWYGLFAPKGTPKDVVGKLSAAVVEALADSSVRSRIAELGQDIFPRQQQTPEAVAAAFRYFCCKYERAPANSSLCISTNCP
jgi:tripartite-type tricarboxylate transporter receptor subunit TctC